MTGTNRLGNRILLALLGLSAIAAGSWVLVRAYPVIALPALTSKLDTTTLWIATAAVTVAIVLSIVWMVTRGRGRTGRLLRDETSDGSVEFDARVATDLLSAGLARQPDLLSVRVASYRVRRAEALLLTVTVRNGCDLSRLRDDVARAVDGLDAVLERRIPVLLHVTSGMRATLAREQRVT